MKVLNPDPALEFWDAGVRANGYTLIPNQLLWLNNYLGPKKVSPAALHLLLILFSHFFPSRDNTTIVYPTRARLCSLSGASRNTIRGYLKELEKAELIKIIEVEGKRNHRYDLAPTARKLEEIARQHPPRHERKIKEYSPAESPEGDPCDF